MELSDLYDFWWEIKLSKERYAKAQQVKISSENFKSAETIPPQNVKGAK
jgi:hypothetical protein